MKTTKLLFAVLLGLGITACNSGKNDATPKEEEVVKMTESYEKARSEFKVVTGIELPALANLEVEEFPYREGTTDYCFDILSGSDVNYTTYQLFEDFFKTTLGDCDLGFPEGDETNGRDAQWSTSSGRWYQTYWDVQNTAIYINTTLMQ